MFARRSGRGYDVAVRRSEQGGNYGGAEVAARFTLDAMPGKQLAIDGDLRAGAIDAEEARKRRKGLNREAQLYGALDGAMRFVKGDAIAGILILVIALIGGLVVGLFKR